VAAVSKTKTECSELKASGGADEKGVKSSMSAQAIKLIGLLEACLLSYEQMEDQRTNEEKNAADKDVTSQVDAVFARAGSQYKLEHKSGATSWSTTVDKGQLALQVTILKSLCPRVVLTGYDCHSPTSYLIVCRRATKAGKSTLIYAITGYDMSPSRRALA
jgi:hypothetical protein